MKIIPKCNKTKRHLCASGSILLPLAQKWGLVGVVACGLFLLGAGNVSAASITLSTPSTLSVDVAPTADGTFAKSKPGSISVTSDVYAGYTLTVKGKADNNALTSGENNLPSITETAGIDESTFNSAAYNNKWGYKPSKKDSTENSKFFPGPKLAGDILDKTNPSSKQSTTTNYTVELGVRVGNNQPAGIYTGTFVFTAAANDLMYSITYDGNGNGTTGTPSKQTGSAAEGAEVTIGNAPTRDKYVFLGWCSQQTKDETCAGEIYQPNGAYKLINDKNELNLHAMWARIMQNWDGCSALAEATTSGDNQISLIDTRDNKLYYVAKLADGNCWMTENLDLDIDQNKTYTAADTDLGYASNDEQNGGGNGSGTYTWKPSESTHPTNEIGTGNWKGYGSQQSYSNTSNGENVPQSYDPGEYCYSNAISSSGSLNQQTIACKKHQEVAGSNPHYYLGNYYNYAAAVGMAVIYALLRVRLNNVQNIFVHQKSNHRRNRHYFSANGPFLLLPLALKWGLLSLLAMFIVPCIMAKGAYAASLTVEVPRDPFSVTVSADSTAKESSPANVTVTSDAYWGYTLSVKSNDANGALTNGNSKINSIGTGITSLSQFTNNTWGFKVSGEGVTDPNNYRQGPTTVTTNLATTTGKKGGQETGTYSFTLAAKVDNTIPTGTYTGIFTFMATANAVNYTINYDDNDGADGPGKVTSQSQEQFVKIAAKEPTKQDRVFLGWCDQEVSNNGTCDGTIYQPGNDYEIKTADQNTTLHAMWDWITMQNWDDCSKNLVKNKQFTLVDSRDSKPYYIAKLTDGNCWMTENLDYDIVAGVTLTAETTDLGYATGS